MLPLLKTPRLLLAVHRLIENQCGAPKLFRPGYSRIPTLKTVRFRFRTPVII